MNCRRFQNDLYEYLEGSLARRAQAKAKAHLSACSACREIVSQERRRAQLLSHQFRAATDSLQLSPEVGHRLLAALDDERRTLGKQQCSVPFWRRFALPVAVAASGLLLAAGFFFFVRSPGPGLVHSQPRIAKKAVSVHFSYLVPVYTFRHEGAFVIDALTYQTNVVDEKLEVELNRLP